MNRSLGFAGIGFVILAILAWDSLFVIEQQEQAIIRQLGAPQRVIREPGLKMKLPFFQDVVIYDIRLLDMDPPVEQVILADQKRLDVDTYTRYRISDPLKFFQALGTEDAARSQLRQIVSSSLRRVLGNITMSSLLSAERTQIMSDIQTQANENAQRFGIEITDVRIKRADLPEETSQAIYERMKSEREREARENRAQGTERAQQIRSRAERERTVILAESQKMAQIAKGQGDAEANRLYAEAYGRDPQFFAFYRAMQAYRTAIGDKDTTLILSPDSEFFKYLLGPGAAGRAR
ncbi:MAG: protease modulator HflC [Alphaproteobacteria bacterium]|nr:protease modulator HflC [Alphaproteobacteria bacterium]